MLQTFEQLWPPALAIAVILAGLFLARWQLYGRAGYSAHRFGTQMAMIGLTALAAVGILLALPVSEATRGQLFSFLGILFSAAIALSSTTFLGNALAGFMLRAVKNFEVGDFIRVEDRFGRVSERGLFHVE
ncbi:MAG: mechanosensitive ion channel domain-containing protein, partial [Gemmatimonadota bacterium]